MKNNIITATAFIALGFSIALIASVATLPVHQTPQANQFCTQATSMVCL